MKGLRLSTIVFVGIYHQMNTCVRSIRLAVLYSEYDCGLRLVFHVLLLSDEGGESGRGVTKEETVRGAEGVAGGQGK